MRRSRAVTAIVLALAFGAVPIVAYWCAATCEAARGTTATAPACHHAGSPVARVGHDPAPCSHQHHPIVVDASATAPNALRTPATLLQVTPFALTVIAPPLAAGGDASSKVPPSPTALPLVLSTTLRI